MRNPLERFSVSGLPLTLASRHDEGEDLSAARLHAAASVALVGRLQHLLGDLVHLVVILISIDDRRGTPAARKPVSSTSSGSTGSGLRFLVVM